jgi:hypothetical protein
MGHRYRYSGAGANSLVEVLRMVARREHELWTLALWVEKHHASDGPNHIAEQVTRLAQEGDFEGVAMWQSVTERYDALVGVSCKPN